MDSYLFTAESWKTVTMDKRVYGYPMEKIHRKVGIKDESYTVTGCKIARQKG